MFIQLISLKNEKISINADKILFCAESKKGTSIVLEDGTIIEVSMTIEDINSMIEEAISFCFPFDNEDIT